MLGGGISRYEHCHDFDDAGIDVIPNTAEEISALAAEMDARLNGTWVADEQDDELQAKFWALWQPSDLNTEFKCRISAQFLRDHHNLLD